MVFLQFYLWLEEALEAADISVGTHRVDGIWGPDTANAYNTFVSNHGVEKFMPLIINPATQRQGNKPANLQRATQIIKYYGGKEKSHQRIFYSTIWNWKGYHGMVTSKKHKEQH